MLIELLFSQHRVIESSCCALGYLSEFPGNTRQKLALGTKPTHPGADQCWKHLEDDGGGLMMLPDVMLRQRVGSLHPVGEEHNLSFGERTGAQSWSPRNSNSD